jgi:abhydrolase domain-containing protein 12
MHILQYPFGNLGNLEKYDLHEARNIYMKTSDVLILKGWHLLQSNCETHVANLIIEERRDDYFSFSLARSNRVVFYFHDSFGSRAYPFRIHIIKKLATILQAHVITIDYRGFADSDGWPTEEGLIKDVKSTLQWYNSHLNDNSAKEEQFFSSDQEILRSECSSTNRGMSSLSEACQDDLITQSCKSILKKTQQLKSPPKFYFYGHSLGASLALAATLEGQIYNDSRFGGLIMEAPFLTLSDAALNHVISSPLQIFSYFKANM